jgi:hypothetical protein
MRAHTLFIMMPVLCQLFLEPDLKASVCMEVRKAGSQMRIQSPHGDAGTMQAGDRAGQGEAARGPRDSSSPPSQQLIGG